MDTNTCARIILIVIVFSALNETTDKMRLSLFLKTKGTKKCCSQFSFFKCAHG